MQRWDDLPYLWRRGGLLLVTLILFFLPWLEFQETAYSGYGFRDFAAAVIAQGGGPRSVPITWDLIFLQPAAILAALLLLWRRKGEKAGDFFAGFAVFVAPIALGMALFEVPAARLAPGGYAVFALALAALVLEFRPGRGDQTGGGEGA